MHPGTLTGGVLGLNPAIKAVVNEANDRESDQARSYRSDGCDQEWLRHHQTGISMQGKRRVDVERMYDSESLRPRTCDLMGIPLYLG